MFCLGHDSIKELTRHCQVGANIDHTLEHRVPVQAVVSDRAEGSIPAVGKLPWNELRNNARR